MTKQINPYATYGLMGLPLAFVALPLYVHLPSHLSTTLGWSLGFTGSLLMAVRLFDAFIDPALGRWSDRLLASSPQHLLIVAACAAALVMLGLVVLFSPAIHLGSRPQWLIGATLLLVGSANSLLTIAHQAWGAALTHTDEARSRIFAWREGAGLVGVLIASALPTWLGWNPTLAILTLAMGLGWLAWRHAPCPTSHPTVPDRTPVLPLPHSPWRNAPFRWLMGVFMLNGIAGAIPASLVVMFMTDRLGASGAWQSALLTLYFASAAIGLPLWLRAVRAWGLVRSWLLGMVLAVLAFAGAALLELGDLWGFAMVCALSGLTLGADLALPSALLAQVVDRDPEAQAHRGLYFGWWALAAKLNLALAAGLALPALGWWGYQPGSADADSLRALSLAYSGWPCGLKLMAALALYRAFLHPHSQTTPLSSNAQVPP